MRAFDPSATWAVHCGNGLDTRFQPLSKYSFQSIQSWPLSLGADMRRREFVRLLGGAAAAWPLAALAQQTERIPRVGALIPYADTDPEAQAQMAVFRDALDKLGLAPGRIVQLDERWTAGDFGMLTVREMKEGPSRSAIRC